MVPLYNGSLAAAMFFNILSKKAPFLITKGKDIISGCETALLNTQIFDDFRINSWYMLVVFNSLLGGLNPLLYFGGMVILSNSGL